MLGKCGETTAGSSLVGLVGTGCTRSDLPVAKIMHHWNISHLV